MVSTYDKLKLLQLIKKDIKMFYSSMLSKGKSFIAKYESKDKATTAAAYQAIGGIMIFDAVIGTPHPLSGKKSTGIWGNLMGVFVGIIFIFAPVLFKFTPQAKMTAKTTGTIVSVSQPQVQTTTNSKGQQSTSSSCTVVAKYVVDGKTYSVQSASGSSSNCSLVAGDTVNVNYNPNNPGSWDSNLNTLKTVVKIFFWAGIAVTILSGIGFIVRLFVVWFGWRLIQRGRSIAKTLPNGGNLASMIENIKSEFKNNIFGV